MVALVNSTYQVAVGQTLYAGIYPATFSSTAILSGVIAAGSLLSTAVVNTGTITPTGTLLTSLSATATSGVGTRPFNATVLPLRGQVPAGSTMTTADGTARAAVLSTHTDGSAAVVVVSGSTGSSGSIPLFLATGTDGTALTSSAIAAQVTSVTVNFGATYGAASINNFATPEKIWWANSKTICARYRAMAATPGTTALEIVVDIHAWADRALVEIVVENGKFAAATATNASLPASASYTAAVVAINGATIATVNSNGAPEALHAPTRAWYAKGWTGAGDPGLRVMQNYLDLQMHPLLFKTAVASTTNLTTYGADAYTPWSVVRQASTSMGGFGDAPWIGPLPTWDTLLLATGDALAAQSVEANALAVVGFNINTRDTAAGTVPDATMLVNKTQNGSTANWPKITAPHDDGVHGGDMGWEIAHPPAVGLMAFITRPSPVFIELAQKVAVWQATWAASPYDQSTNVGDIWGTVYDDGSGYTSPTGYFGQPSQVRGRAWGIRAIAHATFLSPDGSAWKTGGRKWLDMNRVGIDAFRTLVPNPLNLVYNGTARQPDDISTTAAGFQHRSWMHYYLVSELCKVATAQLLSDSVKQAALNVTTDWLASGIVRYVTEQPNGGWRYVWGGDDTVGSSNNPVANSVAGIGSAATWGAARAYTCTDAPSGTTGLWVALDSDRLFAPLTYTAGGPETYAMQFFYPAYFYAALVSSVERGVTGASAAWATVLAGITNWSTWINGFAANARWGSTPRTGVVSIPSWVSTIGNTWTEITASTPFYSSVLATLTPTSGSYKGSDPIRAIRNAFGMPHRDWSNVGVFYLFGGGHSDGSCNAVIKFDATALTYSVVIPPTPPADYPPAFTAPNSSIVYPSGSSTDYFQTTATLTDSRDIPYAAPFVAPQASHGYSGIVAYNNKLQVYYGRSTTADLVAKTWDVSSLNRYGVQIHTIQPNDGGNALQEGTHAVVDKVTGKTWVTANPGSAGNNWRVEFIKIDTTTRVIESLVGIPTTAPDFAGFVGTESITIHNRRAYAFSGVPTSTVSINRGWFVELDTTYPSVGGAASHFTLSGNIPSFVSQATQEQIPCFSDGTNIYLWNYTTEKDFLYRINTTPVSGAGTGASPYVLTSTKVAVSAGLMPVPTTTYRLDYFPEWGVVMTMPTADSKWWALKVPTTGF